jgi:16S rRNA (cytosine1402-N4)-methyltransferase
VDATVGGGGHSSALVECLSKDGTFIGLDEDASALERTRKRLQGATVAVHLVKANFRNLPDVLARLKIAHMDVMVMDLGLSSDQLEQSGRGFSFLKDEPLSMTFTENPSKEVVTAYDVVNVWEEEHLVDILRGFGEEQFAGRIARTITQHRPIETTVRLAEIVKQSVPRWYQFKKIHPATKTFQAIRIAVNDEVGALKEGLAHGVHFLAPNGRIAVISFHSIEDRIVKHYFAECIREGLGVVVNKKPITPRDEEIAQNPRARSAKLRVFEKIC